MMKVKLFTHLDLDGVGCGVIGKTAFKNIDIEYVDYGDVNEAFNNFLDNHGENSEYDRVFMTDISIDEKTASRLDSLPVRFKFSLVDHHGTALWLNKYNWSHIRVEESNLYKSDIDNRDKVESSGTTLFYKFLRDKHMPTIEFNQHIKSFAEVVRKYDTWNWQNIYKDNHPKQLNDLLSLVGREDFVKRFTNNPLPTFTETELSLLSVENYRMNEYISKKKKEVKTDVLEFNGEEWSLAYVFAEQYTSLLGNAIAEEYGNMIDFVAMIDVAYNKVSLRGIHDHIDLGRDVAKYFGEVHGTRGGGHKKACAFEFNNKLASQLFLKSFGVDE